MDACSICTDSYTTLRKAVVCPSCQESVCVRCIKTYLMNNTIEPKCMKCMSAWNMEFIRQNLSKSFLDSEYKKHQISALLSQGEATLGEMQELVAIRTKIDALTESLQTEKSRSESLREELRQLVSLTMYMESGYTFFIHTVRKTEETPTYDNDVWMMRWMALSEEEKKYYWTTVRSTHQRLADKRAELRHIRKIILDQQNEKIRLSQYWEANDGLIPEKTRAVFFMACPRKDCRGRVSSAYKCGLCEHWACPDCHGDKGLERHGSHVCRKEDQETVRLLKQNTKNCPECHEGIFKEHGCDQMWCVRCRTCFSWNTGEKVSGAIHNPHYYEYMFRNGGDNVPMDNAAHACDNGFPNYNSLVRKWRQSESAMSTNDQEMLNNIHRLVQHLRYVELPRLGNIIADHERRNSRKWGVEYLRNRVTRGEWGQKLYTAHRKKEREQRKMDILEMFVMVSCDLYRNWYSNIMTGYEMMESLHKLIQHANDNIQIHNKQYGTKTALLDPSVAHRQHILDYYH